MKFTLRNPIPATVDETWRVIHSPEFIEAVNKENGIRRELLSEMEADGIQTTRERLTFPERLPSVAAKALRRETLSYIQESRTDDQKHQIQWRVLVDGAGNKVKAHGEFRLEANGAGCIRLIRGEVKVFIPLLGSKIEKAIVRKLEESYQLSARFTSQWLTQRIG